MSIIKLFPLNINHSTHELLRMEGRMIDNDEVHFILQVGAMDATEEEVDQMARSLLSELRELDVESAELVSDGPAPERAKGDPIAIGSIAIAVLPTLLPKIVETIQGWLLRGNNRTVKFKGKVGGQTIEFEGPSEDLQKLLATLPKRKKK